jgi:hypothetical protein
MKEKKMKTKIVLSINVALTFSSLLLLAMHNKQQHQQFGNDKNFVFKHCKKCATKGVKFSH